MITEIRENLENDRREKCIFNFMLIQLLHTDIYIELHKYKKLVATICL